MEITTLSNLVALASEVSGLSYEANDAHLAKDTFDDIIDTIFDKIDLLKKWESQPCDEVSEVDTDTDDMEGCESQDDEENEDEDSSNIEETSAENQEDDELLGFYLG